MGERTTSMGEGHVHGREGHVHWQTRLRGDGLGFLARQPSWVSPWCTRVSGWGGPRQLAGPRVTGLPAGTSKGAQHAFAAVSEAGCWLLRSGWGPPGLLIYCTVRPVLSEGESPALPVPACPFSGASRVLPRMTPLQGSKLCAVQPRGRVALWGPRSDCGPHSASFTVVMTTHSLENGLWKTCHF